MKMLPDIKIIGGKIVNEYSLRHKISFLVLCCQLCDNLVMNNICEEL